MNESKIRIQAGLIANNLQHIAAIAGELRRSYDILYSELQSADPQYDRQFEYFMLHLTRTLHALQCDSVTSLAIAAVEMRDFIGGLASREPSASVPRPNGSGTPPSRSSAVEPAALPASSTAA
jgi:hypothetical protein